MGKYIYPLRLPASLKASVAEISHADGTSINQLAAKAVAEKVGVCGPPSSSPLARTGRAPRRRDACCDERGGSACGS